MNNDCGVLFGEGITESSLDAGILRSGMWRSLDG